MNPPGLFLMAFFHGLAPPFREVGVRTFGGRIPRMTGISSLVPSAGHDILTSQQKLTGAPMPTEEEIENLYNEASAQAAEGNNPYPSMTYVEGVRDALAWVGGSSDSPPLEIETGA